MIKSKVVLFTIVESYNEDEFINHHGFKRNVPENLFTPRTKEEEDNDDTDTENIARPDRSKKKKNTIETIAKTLGNNH